MKYGTGWLTQLQAHKSVQHFRTVRAQKTLHSHRAQTDLAQQPQCLFPRKLIRSHGRYGARLVRRLLVVLQADLPQRRFVWAG